MTPTLAQLPPSLQRKLSEFPPRLIRALFIVLEEDMKQEEKVAKDLTATA